MANRLIVQGSNTILYCRNWQETVSFYQDSLALTVTFATDWFVEFQVAGAARLSIADERRATVKSSRGAGVTLTFKVASADKAWDYLCKKGLAVEPVRDHPWGARTFFLYDPEGHRLEFWSERSR